MGTSLTSVALSGEKNFPETIFELRRAFQEGAADSRDYYLFCRRLIEEKDSLLNAVIELNPEGEKMARSGAIPILVKDNIGVAGGMSNSAGSLALADFKPGKDAEVVERLQRHGFFVLGKANMSEWANFRSTNSTSGWSARGGQCRNPHALNRSACGSSSGSAAAVAAGFVPAALGTETMGSIICPASVCGVVGMKPTWGLVSNEGVIPGAHTTDCVGPITRRVSDAAVVLNAIAGSTQDYTSQLRRGALKGKRIGINRRTFGFDSRVDRIVEEQIQVLKELGAEIVGEVKPAGWRTLGPYFRTVSLYELKWGLNEYLGRRPSGAKVRSLAQIIAFNEAHPEEEAMSYLGQDMLIEAQRKGPLSDEAYEEALRKLREASDLSQILEEKNLDAVLGPSNGPAWTIDFVNGDHFEGGSSTSAAVAGCPHITVPAGRLHGLPIGLSLYGPKNSEATLLGMAYDYEQETDHLLKPQFKPQVP